MERLREAVLYIETVKRVYQNRPAICSQFLDCMKLFRDGSSVHSAVILSICSYAYTELTRIQSSQMSSRCLRTGAISS